MALTNDQLKHLVNLGDLQHYDGKLKGNFYISKQAEAESGFAATYIFHGTSNANNVKINIPKDYLVKNAEVKVCAEANVPVEGYVVGDKYIDFTVNTIDGTGTETHLYIAVKDLVSAYTAGDGINITANNAIEVRTGDGIQINATSKAIEANVGDGIGINGTSKAIEAKVGAGLGINGTSKAIDAKVGVGLEINGTNNAIDLVAQSSDAGAPAVGGVSTADYAAFKGALDTITAPTETAPTADATKNETIVTKTHTFTTADVDETAGSFTVTEYYATYGNAVPSTTGETPVAGKAGLMSGTDKDGLDALINVFGTDVAIATTAEIDELFPTV